MRASRVSPWPVNKRTHANPAAVAASFSTESAQTDLVQVLAETNNCANERLCDVPRNRIDASTMVQDKAGECAHQTGRQIVAHARHDF